MSYPPIECADGSSHYACSDPTFSFDIVPIEKAEDEDYFPDTKVEFLDLDKVDYQFGEYNLPLSFLSITSREEGEQWYRTHTKVPEDMIAYLGRYHWGDLHPQHDASTSGDGRTRRGRKGRKKFSKNKGKFKVDFD
eukprot:SAG31_NODE_4227_length_3444_cov_20.637668_4_plen_136_part_00